MVSKTMAARIYKPARTAMQSGPARTKEWVLEYEPEAPREIEPLMGWTSSRDMKSQIRLAFDTREEAIAYAERNGIAYRFVEPKPRAPCASPTPTTSASAAASPGPIDVLATGLPRLPCLNGPADLSKSAETTALGGLTP